MPQTTNFTQAYAGLANAQSVRGWFFPGPPFEYPQPPAAMPLPEAEVAANAAFFVVFEVFSGRNATGTTLGRGSIDTGKRTALAAYKATTTEELLTTAYPPPGPD